jgi:hypothetical protein
MLAISKTTQSAIISTWDSIASDAYDLCEGDNEIAVELTIDASRLAMNGYVDAQAEISELCKAHGFGVVRAALSKTIQLL